MAKGCCGSSGCSCQLIGHGAVEITGSGQPSDPFILDVDLNLGSSTNKTFTVVVDGDGSTADPYTLETSFTSTAQLDDLPDVQAPAPTNGQVLAWNATLSRWVPQPPTTAAAGSVLHNTSLDGDGSAGTPLAVLPAPSRGLATFPAGLGLTDASLASMVQRFVDTAARATAIPTPTLNQLTVLDTNPGVINYWNGTVWSVLPNQTTWNAVGGEFLALSGPYTPGLPVTVMTKQITDTTDGLGVFEVLDSTDLAGASGVLAVQLTESGSIGWKAVLNPVSNQVVATAYRIADGTVLAGTPVSGVMLAILY